MRTILKRLAVEAGADPGLATPHRLRHYFGLSAARARVPTTALMRAMGHRSPIITARYSEFADSEHHWAFARADITKGIRLPSRRQADRVCRSVLGAGRGSPEMGTASGDIALRSVRWTAPMAAP